MSNGASTEDDNVRLNADNFVLNLYKNKSFNDAFFSGIKWACVILALVTAMAQFPKFPMENKSVFSS